VDRHFKNYKGQTDDDLLQYVTGQLGEMIEYVEAKVPGCKFNQDYLIELQEYDRQYLQYFQQLWKLKAAIPCPLSGRDSFRELRLADMYADPKKALEYMRLYVEEVGERVEKGWGAAQPKEKLRLLWSVAGPFYADPFSWLEQRGVSIPAAEMTVYNGWFSGREAIWGDPWKGRKLTPLEEEARQIDFTWGRLGDQWVNTHINSCRDLHLDGIIYFLQWGCPTSNNLGKVVADVAEKELEIPTLLIEGRMLESSIYDEKDFYSKLSDFMEVCQARKETRSPSTTH
jgi:benzoyl-CoA reductase/2-hydroxyglutaryl-CoA dehydratase subunit BcrC/BadD/HgdB